MLLRQGCGETLAVSVEAEDLALQALVEHPLQALDQGAVKSQRRVAQALRPREYRRSVPASLAACHLQRLPALDEHFNSVI